jgi:hypothetical protein
MAATPPPNRRGPPPLLEVGSGYVESVLYSALLAGDQNITFGSFTARHPQPITELHRH